MAGDHGDHALPKPFGDFLPENYKEEVGGGRAASRGARRLSTADILQRVHDHDHSMEAEARMNHYFAGPRDTEHESRLPLFMRLHGSVLPKMLISLILIGGWATLITCVSKFVTNLGVDSLLLTVLGFLVGLSLSYINSTAYERYSDGRKAWSNLSLGVRNLARMTWIHIVEREGELGKQDLLAKLSAINLLLAFAIALKHRLRFEPHAHYEDLCSLVMHLDTFAGAAHGEQRGEIQSKKPKSTWHTLSAYLGLSWADIDSRREMKQIKKPMGNLPLDILMHLNAYYHTHITGNFANTAVYVNILGPLSSLTDVVTQTERVLNTPVPEAYSIVISQITLIYVLALPFQLYKTLGWITIPGTIAAAYIILGMALIGHEIENPFGHDVNDLPLDAYCLELAQELDMITSTKPPSAEDFLSHTENRVLWPLSQSGAHHWGSKGEDEIREALAARVVVGRGKSRY